MLDWPLDGIAPPVEVFADQPIRDFNPELGLNQRLYRSPGPERKRQRHLARHEPDDALANPHLLHHRQFSAGAIRTTTRLLAQAPRTGCSRLPQPAFHHPDMHTGTLCQFGRLHFGLLAQPNEHFPKGGPILCPKLARINPIHPDIISRQFIYRRG